MAKPLGTGQMADLNADLSGSESEGVCSVLEDCAIASPKPGGEYAGGGARMQDDDEQLQDENYNSLTPEDLGTARWSKRLENLHTTRDVTPAVTGSSTSSDCQNPQRCSSGIPNSFLGLCFASSIRNRQ